MIAPPRTHPDRAPRRPRTLRTTDRATRSARQPAHRVVPRSVVLTIEELRTLLDDALHRADNSTPQK